MQKQIEKQQVSHNAVSEAIIEDDVLYNRTVFYDDNTLHNNQRIRTSGMLDKAKLELHHNEDVRMVFSIPSPLQYSFFKKKHPDVYALLMSKNEHERMRGAKQMQLLHPEWCVMERL